MLSSRSPSAMLQSASVSWTGALHAGALVFMSGAQYLQLFPRDTLWSPVSGDQEGGRGLHS